MYRNPDIIASRRQWWAWPAATATGTFAACMAGRLSETFLNPGGMCPAWETLPEQTTSALFFAATAGGVTAGFMKLIHVVEQMEGLADHPGYKHSNSLKISVFMMALACLASEAARRGARDTTQCMTNAEIQAFYYKYSNTTPSFISLPDMPDAR